MAERRIVKQRSGTGVRVEPYDVIWNLVCYLLKTTESVSKLAGFSKKPFSSAARRAEGKRATGARVIPSR